MTPVTVDPPMDVFHFLYTLGICPICKDNAKEPVRPICGCKYVYCRDCAFKSWTSPRVSAEYDASTARSQRRLVNEYLLENRDAACPMCNQNLVENYLHKKAFETLGADSSSFSMDRCVVSDQNPSSQHYYEAYFDWCWIPDKTLVAMAEQRLTCPDDDCKGLVYGNIFCFMMHLVMKGHIQHFPEYNMYFEAFDKNQCK